MVMGGMTLTATKRSLHQDRYLKKDARTRIYSALQNNTLDTDISNYDWHLSGLTPEIAKRRYSIRSKEDHNAKYKQRAQVQGVPGKPARQHIRSNPKSSAASAV